METFMSAMLLVAAALSYQMPIYAARLFGKESALNDFWKSVGNETLPSMILFFTGYMIVGLLMWLAPLVFVTMLADREQGAGLRQRISALVGHLLLPARPLLHVVVRQIDQWEGDYIERKKLKDTYVREFADQFESFHQFRNYYRWINDQNYRDPREPFTASSDKFHDAVILLGLPSGFSLQDLNARFSKLIKAIHPDIVGPNDLARRLTDARGIIKARKGWK